MSNVTDHQRDVYTQAFFQKLAAHGIRPHSDEDVQTYLNLAQGLRQVGGLREQRVNQLAKTAADRLGRVLNGDEGIDNLLGLHKQAKAKAKAKAKKGC